LDYVGEMVPREGVPIILATVVRTFSG